MGIDKFGRKIKSSNINYSIFDSFEVRLASIENNINRLKIKLDSIANLYEKNSQNETLNETSNETSKEALNEATNELIKEETD
jgi:hypothetical protein